MLSREAHALRLGNHAVRAADRPRPAKHLRPDTRYHPRPARVPRWCPTKVILVAEVQLRGVYKPMELVMRWVTRQQFGMQLRTLKNLLESEAFR